MHQAYFWQRVSDGDRHGLVVDIIHGDRRGLEGGSVAEVRIQWDCGEFSWESVEDLFEEAPQDDTRPRW